MTRANLYGAALAPGPATGVDGLWAVGDSTYPGIGVPAAAGRGFRAEVRPEDGVARLASEALRRR